MRQVSEFIAQYSSKDEPRICFKWNGSHGDDFEDQNMEFRNAVREVVLEHMPSTSLVLIRDLYRAETQCSREAWGIVSEIHLFAEALLCRGGTLYLDDYLEGRFQSFDAQCGTAFDMDLALAKTMLEELQNRMKSSPDSPQMELWQSGEKMFLTTIKYLEKKN